MEMIVVLVILAAIAFWIVSIYNKLVTLKNRFKNGFAQLEVQLKRRYDLIPNLVETAKGYIKHERETLEAVIKARNQAITGLAHAAQNPGNPAAMQELAGAEGALGSNMMQLSEELTTTENKVSFARQAYNDQVTEYNTYKQTFPPIVFAGMFGHGTDAELLDYEDRVAFQAPPKVAF
jgi:LemA protein